MARFAVVEQPSPTPTTSSEFLMLREVVSRLHSQTKQTTRFVNQLHNLLSRVFPELATLVHDMGSVGVLNLLAKYPTPERIVAARKSMDRLPHVSSTLAQRVREAARQSVAALCGETAQVLVKELVEQVREAKKAEKRLEKLLEQTFDSLPDSRGKRIMTITGIGKRTAAILVAKIVSIDRFAAPKNLVGYFGYFPEESSSGVDKHGRPVKPGSMRMSAKGNDLARAYLWMAAKSALVHNPAVRPLYARLRAKGTRGDVAIGHCVRKLLHLVFAIWKTDRPFNPNHYPWERNPQQPDRPRQPAQENAASPKQEQVPENKEVTAAKDNLEPHQHDVNSLPANRSVDYAHLRHQIGMEQVLRHIDWWDRMQANGNELRGSCPIHARRGTKSRTFSVNVKKNVFHCFGKACNQSGNVLDFWAAYHRLNLHEAALHLAQTFGLSVNRTEKRSP